MASTGFLMAGRAENTVVSEERMTGMRTVVGSQDGDVEEPCAPVSGTGGRFP
jgi:hypothetical protein